MFKKLAKYTILSLLCLSFLMPSFVNAADCGLTNPVGCINSFGAALGTAALGVAANILTLSGWALDKSIDYVILRTTDIVNGIGAIDTIWKIFRDLSNLLFIFILLYAAIGLMLDLPKVDSKAMVTKVIVIAVLINFSLFFAKVAIDSSNIFTVAFYNQVKTIGVNSNGQPVDVKGQVTTENDPNVSHPPMSLSQAFMGALKLTSVYGGGPSSISGQMDKLDNLWQILLITVLGTIFFLIAAFIFFAAAILFIIRFVFVIILLGTSSIAFGAYAFPNGSVGKIWSMWKDNLIKICIFPPVYMLLIMIGLQITNSIFNNPEFASTGGFADAFAQPNGGSVTVIINFAVASIMMILPLIVATQMGVAGAKAFNDTGKKWLNGLGGFVAKAPLRPIARASDKFGKTWAGNTWVGQTINKATLGKISKTKILGSSIADDRKKEADARDKRNEGMKKALEGSAEKMFKKQQEAEKPLTENIKAGEKKKTDLEKAKGEIQNSVADANLELERVKSSKDTRIAETTARETTAEKTQLSAEEAKLKNMESMGVSSFFSQEQIDQQRQHVATLKSDMDAKVKTIAQREETEIEREIADQEAKIIQLNQELANNAVETFHTSTSLDRAKADLRGMRADSKVYKDFKKDSEGNIIGIPSDAKAYAKDFLQKRADKIKERAEPFRYWAAEKARTYLPQKITTNKFVQAAAKMTDKTLKGFEYATDAVTGQKERREDLVKEYEGKKEEERDKKKNSPKVAAERAKDDKYREEFLKALSPEDKEKIKNEIDKA